MIWQPFDDEPSTWSYAELAHDAAAVASGMAHRGITVGDRIILHLENSPEFVISWLACTALGAVAVATNARSTDEEMAYFIADAEPKAIVTQPKFVDRLAHIAPRVEWLACTSHDSGEAPTSRATPAGVTSFHDLMGDPADVVAAAPDPFAPMCVQYTSGTTSRPKGVVWTQANGIWAARTNAVHEGLTPDDCYLCYLPLFHTNALAYTMLASLWVGSRFVVIPKWSTTRFWSISLRHGCTWTSVVGLTLRAIEGLPPPPEHSYRIFGGACDVESLEAIGVKGLGWWGMTETVSQPIVGDPYTPNRPWSMGRPSPEYDIAVLDDDGRPVAAEQVGNLLVRGERGVSIFLEYLNDPKATAASFTPDGWFRTGDRVVWHADGHLSFADRSKDMLRVGGENVAASEVERVVLEVPGVIEVAVVGQPHPALDEVAVAFVIAEGDPELVRSAVVAACGQRLADFKVPRQVYVVADLPRSTLEKVNKAALRAMAAANATATVPAEQ